MPERTYFTYIMASRSHTLYIGMTSNLQHRVFQHKWREKDGFTARYNCDRLVWFQLFSEVSDAIQREKELKGWRREKKIALIEQTNPTWQELSRDWYAAEPADTGRHWASIKRQPAGGPAHPRERASYFREGHT